MRAIRTITAPALAGALVFFLAGPAFAGEAQPATSLSTPEEAPRPQPMVTCCHLWVGAATTAESPYLTLGLTLDRGAYLAVGVSFCGIGPRWCSPAPPSASRTTCSREYRA